MILNPSARARSTIPSISRPAVPWPRNAGGAPSLDDRDYDVGQMVYFRIRKTLGG